MPVEGNALGLQAGRDRTVLRPAGRLEAAAGMQRRRVQLGAEFGDDLARVAPAQQQLAAAAGNILAERLQGVMQPPACRAPDRAVSQGCVVEHIDQSGLASRECCGQAGIIRQTKIVSEPEDINVHTMLAKKEG